MLLKFNLLLKINILKYSLLLKYWITRNEYQKIFAY